MHNDAYIGGRSENDINASSITISGGRTKQLDIFCRVTGFTSDFLSFIVVELIRFFHRALQLMGCWCQGANEGLDNPVRRYPGGFSAQQHGWKTPSELRVSKSLACEVFPQVLGRCWLDDRKGVLSWISVCWW